MRSVIWSVCQSSETQRKSWFRVSFDELWGFVDSYNKACFEIKRRMNQTGTVVVYDLNVPQAEVVILNVSVRLFSSYEYSIPKTLLLVHHLLLVLQLWQVENEDGPNLPCDTCNGKGWLVCDFCKGQKTNVQVRANKFYRRCPSCRAVSFPERTQFASSLDSEGFVTSLFSPQVPYHEFIMSLIY